MSGRARVDGRRCFVCGPENPIGLGIEFGLRDDRCVAEFTPGENHVGFDGVTHGGIIYSALDDVMANWLYLRGARGYTARCEVRYRAHVGVGEPVRLEARLVRRKRRMVVLEGRVCRAADGAVLAEALGTFMLEDAGSLDDGGATE